jgi:hypothetical protein
MRGKYPINLNINGKLVRLRLCIIWGDMIQRCTNPKRHNYKYYGAKGIKVCIEWRKYQSFAEWAYTHGYQENLTIDRIDADKDYCPENCRWITASENSARVDQTTKEGIRNPRSHPVVCVETGQLFETAAEASSSMGLTSLTVVPAARKGGRSGGYHWQYLSKEEYWNSISELNIQGD